MSPDGLIPLKLRRHRRNVLGGQDRQAEIARDPRPAEAPPLAWPAMSYEVRTPVYEGPFELLLHLILKEEVDLWDVSITHVIDAFLVEVEELDRVDLAVATEFLLIASTLVELKVRRLLPGDREHRARRGAAAVRGAGPAPGPAARVQDVQGRGPGARSACSRRGGKVVSRTAGPEEPFRSLAPDPLERVTPAQLLAAAIRGLTPPAPAPEVGPVPRRADPRQRPRSRRRGAPGRLAETLHR